MTIRKTLFKLLLAGSLVTALFHEAISAEENLPNGDFALDNIPQDESGYEAWLRYLPGMAVETIDGLDLARLHVRASGPSARAAVDEWERAMRGLFGMDLLDRVSYEEAGVVFEVDSKLGFEEYVIEAEDRLLISGGSEIGLLYGVYACLRKLQMGLPPGELKERSAPTVPLRMLNHWDNLKMSPTLGSIERVRGGKTIFDWTDLSYPNPRYQDYGRMLASVGINGVSLNNVNADPEILKSETIEGVATLAEVLRPYGIRIFLTINYASPVLIGGLKTADPLDSQVRHWWKDKVDEIYAQIPDFGGFLVKADSEGLPGPGTYGRSHVEGSGVLADALAPHGGLVLWRAFVYGRDFGGRDLSERVTRDRANHATLEFEHLDGQFADNVILQIKYSAIDFQIWEPVHALFGRMPNTRLAIELDLAKEYKGYDTTIAWEGRYFSEILNTDMGWDDPSCTVAEVVGGKVQNRLPGAITAVSNINNSRNWFGHLMSGASLFTYGRQAWDPGSDPVDILKEWAVLTFGEAATPVVVDMLDGSYDTMARYMGLLGNHSLSELQHHYEPDPWEWLFAHEAGITDSGLGVDRTIESGSGYLGLYHPDLRAEYADPESCPVDQLLYFHHLPWEYQMPDGRSLIQYLYDQYYTGVEEVGKYRAQWRSLLGIVDMERWAHVHEKLALQEQHAERWRDLMCRYFLERSGVPDEQERFSERSPSPHNRIRTGFWSAVEDYRARVQRERERIGGLVEATGEGGKQ